MKPMRAIDAELARRARSLWEQARALVLGEEGWEEPKFRAELTESALFAWLVLFERLHHLRASLAPWRRDWKRGASPETPRISSAPPPSDRRP